MVHISFYSHQISTTLCLRKCLFLSCHRWNDNISPQVDESVGMFAMYWHFPWKVNIHRCGVPTKLARTHMLSDTPEWEHPKPSNSNPSSSNYRQSFWSIKCVPSKVLWQQAIRAISTLVATQELQLLDKVGGVPCFWVIGMFCPWPGHVHLEAPHTTWCQAVVEEAIRKAMNRHPTDADIAEYGLQALDRLGHAADEMAQEVGSESGLRSSLPLLAW